MGRIPLLPSDSTERRLQKATYLMDEICANPGKASLHRANMRTIEVQIDLSGKALGDFLINYFQNKYTQNQGTEECISPVSGSKRDQECLTAIYKCAGCQKSFDNPKAFQGHGQSRCLQKRATAAATKA